MGRSTADAGSGRSRRPLRWLGGGVITGAADDDPSAIGTYASTGAKYGLGALWIAPVLLPMMYVVMYVSAKLGRVYGKGLFAAMLDRFPRGVVYPMAALAFIGNVIEAAANLGGVGAALNLLLPLPVWAWVAVVAVVVTGLQVLGSYDLLRRIFRWLALALFAYIAAAVMAKPDAMDVLRGTLARDVRFDAGFVGMLVACIGTSLSAYVYTWQSNQEVEERVDAGDPDPSRHPGASDAGMRVMRRDVVAGVAFSNIVLYFIIMSTGATLYANGQHDIESAAQAASALEPVAGSAARWLFALGVVGVGFLAIPVMTTGAAYDLVQVFRRPGSLHSAPREAPLFYGTILAVTVVAVALNLLGFNPMRALVWSGVVQGFSVPPLLLLIMIMTSDRRMMGDRANGTLTRVLGWSTVAITGATTVALVVLWATGRT
ncbi:divalent metal cation transporter [Luteibacter sp. 3190]|uniref:NRAMP family divalent metal transporter n=1 Tax=Luteibacter sp. 3190 TaxID=2817736 RepID=UPI002867436C|nr:divalent metal cation transporter [Luteibacter sp. 3190]MDR6935604.1 Mn2+/Fe2+ NRAMP family transporter [Luteibacter sp. 3190]